MKCIDSYNLQSKLKIWEELDAVGAISGDQAMALLAARGQSIKVFRDGENISNRTTSMNLLRGSVETYVLDDDGEIAALPTNKDYCWQQWIYPEKIEIVPSKTGDILITLVGGEISP